MIAHNSPPHKTFGANVLIFITFTLSQSFLKLVYTRLELSPLNLSRFGPQQPKCPKIFPSVFASLYVFAVLVDWRFGTSQNAHPDTATFSSRCERYPESPMFNALLTF